MSERITWIDCPRCGQLAAAGWAPPSELRDRAADTERLVEFDCIAGCAVPLAELVGSSQTAID
jgi:hypothetical protein